MWLPSEVARLRAVSSFRQSPSWSRKESAKKKANIENCGSPRGTVGVSCSALTTSTIFLDDFFFDGLRRKGGTARTVQKGIYSRIPSKKVFFTFNHVYMFYQTRDMYFDRSCKIGSTHYAKIDCYEHINLLCVF